MIQHQRKSAEYLRILTSGVAGEDDYALAAELIDEGYASGRVLRNGLGASTPFACVTLDAITAKGSALIGELRHRIRQAARRLFLMRCAMLIAAAFVGLSLGIGLKRSEIFDRFEPIAVATKAMPATPHTHVSNLTTN